MSRRAPYGQCDVCADGPRALVAIRSDLDGLAWQYLCGPCWDEYIDAQRATERATTEAHRRADNREARA